MFDFFKNKPIKIDSQLDALKSDLTQMNQSLINLQSRFDAQTKELELSKSTSVNSDQENDLLLAQLMQVQEELESIYLKNTQFDEQAKELELAKAASAKAKQEGDSLLKTIKDQLSGANQSLVSLKSQFDEQAKELELAKAASAKAKQEGDSLLKTIKDQLSGANQSLVSLKSQFDEQAKELELAKAASAKAKQEGQALGDSAREDKKKLVDSMQENELLLVQLMQVQEELESYYIEKINFENLYRNVQDRWTRLEVRYPNYIDFGSVELISFNNLSDVPSIIWRVKDYTQSGVTFDEFFFETVLQDGWPGIRMVSDAKISASENIIFIPGLVKQNSKQHQYFLNLSQIEFRKIMASAAILSQCEISGWRGLVLPNDFDLGFWRESLKLLPKQLQALPASLRYETVKLKRELINSDYEHLWLEFEGLSLGVQRWKKFEIRLGAALIQFGGFSQFPKYEIPLIDGRIKPFDSWYAESYDDNGDKLELRFALEKNIFDMAVWSKLSGADKVFLLQIIYAMPNALKQLEKQKTAIHRPWLTWIDFAISAVKVLEGLNKVEKIAPPKADALSNTVPKLNLQPHVVSTETKVSKVISVTNKTAAKSIAKTKTIAKAKPAPKVRQKATL